MGPTEISFQPGQVTVGLLVGEGVKAGGRAGLEWQGQDVQAIVTSRGYLDSIGLDTFGKMHAPDTTLTMIGAVPGYWSSTEYYHWERGYDVLVRKMSNTKLFDEWKIVP